MDEIIVQVVLMYYNNEDYKTYLQSQLPEVQDQFYKIVEVWNSENIVRTNKKSRGEN